MMKGIKVTGVIYARYVDDMKVQKTLKARALDFLSWRIDGKGTRI